ncbi:hypothetical protein AMQ84_06020 [Paenibacillus riograndensis]|uniref:Uncharacterized protein n=1 Tax=Paenibacillus riograndensis TaxID=483937 RepID=A0A132U7Q5_9BACL|nr:hypothetical protein AMQ84_06020 [Paenibacillus riograndensis]KWX85160.1 hypothetical protein AMQ83_26455 [Paenibacillus riograndensis]
MILNLAGAVLYAAYSINAYNSISVVPPGGMDQLHFLQLFVSKSAEKLNLLYSVQQIIREKRCGPEIPEINCTNYSRMGFEALLLKFCCTKCN